MMCLGWTQTSDCGRKEQIAAPTNPMNGACPDITWFWAGLGLVLGLTAMGKRR
jgi:hypothetical protein